MTRGLFGLKISVMLGFIIFDPTGEKESIPMYPSENTSITNGYIFVKRGKIQSQVEKIVRDIKNRNYRNQMLFQNQQRSKDTVGLLTNVAFRILPVGNAK